MKVLSVNVGLPREVTWRGKPVRTGIYKEPVRGRVAVSTLYLAGDGQADLRVHGGRDKAVYAYSSEYYELWSRGRPELELGPGAFGENLTTEGLLDEDVSIPERTYGALTAPGATRLVAIEKALWRGSYSSSLTAKFPNRTELK
jgi:MOSC domain-containing protein YiiM